MRLKNATQAVRMWSHFKIWHVIAILLALLIGALFTVYAYRSQDQEMRDNLTTYARTIEQSINWNGLMLALKTSPAPDKIAPEKLAEIKQQMRNACNANKQCHFIYLVYGENQQVKFLLDASDQPASEISQMGEVFYEASNALKDAIQKENAFVEGPVTDHWGTWVSSFVPVTPTQKTSQFVLMGVDVAVVGWNKHLLKNTIVPIAITFVALMAILGLVYQNANKEWRLTQLANTSLDLAHKANVDALTGLPNRNLLDKRMSQLFSSADRTESLVAVLYVDLDHFKEVNDSFGHTIGDQLLKTAAERLAMLISDRDTIARVGGDEFIILLAELENEATAINVAQKIVDAMAEQFEIEGKLLQLGASVGLSFYPTQNTDPYRLIHYADIAMYNAKRQGRGRFSQYDASMETLFH
jgi:diguanylate cyclase (GGDEF)-like protein